MDDHTRKIQTERQIMEITGLNRTELRRLATRQLQNFANQVTAQKTKVVDRPEPPRNEVSQQVFEPQPLTLAGTGTQGGGGVGGGAGSRLPYLQYGQMFISGSIADVIFHLDSEPTF